MRRMWVFWLVMALPGTAFGACSNPVGQAGHVFYNTSYNVLQYCNGTHWMNAGAVVAGAAQTGCSSQSISFVPR